MRRYVSILAILAVIVISVLLVAAWSFIGSLLHSPSQQPTMFDVSATRVDDGGHGSISVAPDGRSGSINGSKATLAGENEVVISLTVRQSPASGQSGVSFVLTVDAPSYVQQSTGWTQNLVLPDAHGCPDIVYFQSGSGSGANTTQPCGYAGSVPSGGNASLTMRIAINGAFFSNMDVTTSQWPLVIHTSSGNDLLVTWYVSG